MSVEKDAGLNAGRTMRAMVLHKQRPVEEAPLRLEVLPVREPGPGEVRLKVIACGVCHTDLHLVVGDLPSHRMPVVPGHQIVGIVDVVGPGVSDRRPGDRVGIGWLHKACGACAFCTRGEENLCPRARFTGYDEDGGYAEGAFAPAAFTFPIPEEFSDVAAAPLLCAGVIGFRALRLAEARRGDWVGLYGFGASAHLALQVARAWGCEVAVVTRGAKHREMAAHLGAAWVGGPDETPPRPLDRAVVFAPSGDVVREALSRVRPGGTVAVNAIHLDRIPEMPYGLLYGERTLRSVTNFTRRDASDFLALAASVPVRVEVETFPLEAANPALGRMMRRELRAAAVLIP